VGVRGVAVRCRPRSAIRAVGAELAVHKLASGSAIVASTIKGVPADVHAMQILSHRAAQLKDEQHAMFHHFAPENTRTELTFPHIPVKRCAVVLQEIHFLRYCSAKS